MASISLDLSGGSGSVECQANFNFQVSLVYFPISAQCRGYRTQCLSHRLCTTNIKSSAYNDNGERVNLSRRMDLHSHLVRVNNAFFQFITHKKMDLSSRQGHSKVTVVS